MTDHYDVNSQGTLLQQAGRVNKVVGIGRAACSFPIHVSRCNVPRMRLDGERAVFCLLFFRFMIEYGNKLQPNGNLTLPFSSALLVCCVRVFFPSPSMSLGCNLNKINNDDNNSKKVQECPLSWRW